jgi:uncharacterized protein (DUF1778 family)
MSIPYPAERSARLSMRIAPDALETIREAAIAQQQDITGFVLGAAMDRARAVVLEERKLRARLEERKLRARLEERALRAGSAETAPADDDDFDNDVADDNRWLFPEMAPMVREAWRALGLPSQ